MTMYISLLKGLKNIYPGITQWTQNICITFIQRRPSVEDVSAARRLRELTPAYVFQDNYN